MEAPKISMSLVTTGYDTGAEVLNNAKVFDSRAESAAHLTKGVDTPEEADALADEHTYNMSKCRVFVEHTRALRA